MCIKHSCTYITRDIVAMVHRINNMIRSYQWHCHPLMWVTLHVMKSKTRSLTQDKLKILKTGRLIQGSPNQKRRITIEQSTIQVIMQAAIEATISARIEVTKADLNVNNARVMHAMARSSSPTLWQPTFDWKGADK